MKRDFLTFSHRAMNHLESIAFAFYAGNIISAVDREGIQTPCAHKIRKAWQADSRARERWINTVETILERTHLTMIDLGGSKAELNRVPKGKRPMRAFDVASLVVIAAVLGAIVGYYLSRL